MANRSPPWRLSLVDRFRFGRLPSSIRSIFFMGGKSNFLDFSREANVLYDLAKKKKKEKLRVMHVFLHEFSFKGDLRFLQDWPWPLNWTVVKRKTRLGKEGYVTLRTLLTVTRHELLHIDGTLSEETLSGKTSLVLIGQSYDWVSSFLVFVLKKMLI